MFLTLFAKLATAIVAVSVMLSVALAVVLESSHEIFHLELQQQLFRPLAALLLSDANAGSASKPDLEQVLERVRQLSILNRGIAAFLVGPDGAVLRSSRRHEELRRSAIAIEPILRFIEGPRKWPLTGEDPLSDSGRTIFSAARIEPPSHGARFLYIVLNSAAAGGPSAVIPAERSYSLQDALWLTLGNIAAAFLAALAVVRIITRPVTRLRQAMETFDRSQFTAGARYGANRRRWVRDEIDRLGEIFDSMAERIAAQLESLRRSDEIRRELFANISHDLRTPLTAVQGYVDTLLAKQNLSDADRTMYLRIVQRQAGQLSSLVDQAMDLARLDAPEMQPSLGDFSLDELASDVVAEMRPLLDRKELQVPIEAPSTPLRITGDANLVGRALRNLLANAIRVSPNGGSIRVRVAANPANADVTISDQGPGVPAEEIEHIFGRFYRGADAGANSVGLGLAIVRRIVELHAGSISVENRAEGGATFRLTFPRSRPQSAVQGRETLLN